MPADSNKSSLATPGNSTMKVFPKGLLALAALGIIILPLISGCATTEPRPQDPTLNSAEPAQAGGSYTDIKANPTLEGLTAGTINPELESLWKTRRGDSKDFAVGQGDVLEIQVPSVKDLEDRTVRVDGQGNIDLPLLGPMHVAGLSESELNSQLVNRLGDYLYHPQAEVFVKSYNNRQVAVTGEVRAPADYVLNGPQDTVRDLIQRAGGMTQQAAPEIVLTPGSASIDPSAPVSSNVKTRYSPASYQTSSANPNDQPPAFGEVGSNFGHPLIIDLSRNSHQGRYLDLPVRPGDTIFVPVAGTVATIGWVYHPETIPITESLSVTGAVAASGGAMYAADTHNVKILRREKDGHRDVMTVAIASIQAGKVPDVPLRDGDIIDVSYSTAKLPLYGLYYALQGIVSFAPAALLVSGVP